MELSKFIKEFLSIKENEQAVMDYIFGKTNHNPLEDARKQFRQLKSKTKENK